MCAMKHNEKRVCLQLHANIDDSHNMFEGYNGRRRLKTTIALCLAFIILLALLHRPKSEILLIFTLSKFYPDYFHVFFRADAIHR